MMVSKTYYVDTTKSIDILLISHEIRRLVQETRPEIGQVSVIVPFPGAGLAVFDKDVSREVLVKELAPYLKNQLIHVLLPKSMTLLIEKGKLANDPWQDIFLIDYDTSSRRREFRVFSETAAAAGKPGAPGNPMPPPQPGGR
ncbi:MAG: YjbQ family protein [Deltaproteobacteria bacterium]|nr:MAG: YjbQ family protein [Deltaproteobacteria bacterium]